MSPRSRSWRGERGPSRDTATARTCCCVRSPNALAPGGPARSSRRRAARSRWHEAPDPDCTCGLHGTHGLEVLRKTRCPAVLGRVALWGRVIEHEHGYRARFAYPQRLRLLCQFCFWKSGVRRPAPEHVGWFPRDELMPLCEDHLAVAERHGVHPGCCCRPARWNSACATPTPSTRSPCDATRAPR